MDKRDWNLYVFDAFKNKHNEQLKHAKTLERLGLHSAPIETQSDEQLIAVLIQKLNQVKKFVYLYCPLFSPKNNLDLTSSLKAQINSGLQTNNTVQKFLREFPLYDRKGRYNLDETIPLNKTGVDVFCSRLLQGVNLELRFALEKRLTLWLSQIPIGGREKRYYDVRPFLDFAIARGLEADSPETIYSAFVENKLNEANDAVERDDGNLEQFHLLPMPSQPEQTVPRKLTQSSQLCIGQCKVDKSRHGVRSTCKTAPYGPFGLYEWDFCDT